MAGSNWYVSAERSAFLFDIIFIIRSIVYTFGSQSRGNTHLVAFFLVSLAIEVGGLSLHFLGAGSTSVGSAKKRGGH